MSKVFLVPLKAVGTWYAYVKARDPKEAVDLAARFDGTTVLLCHQCANDVDELAICGDAIEGDITEVEPDDEDAIRFWETVGEAQDQ